MVPIAEPLIFGVEVVGDDPVGEHFEKGQAVVVQKGVDALDAVQRLGYQIGKVPVTADSLGKVPEKEGGSAVVRETV